MIDDRPIALAVIGLEGGERLVGKHHAEAERVVRPVALEHDDIGVRAALLHQDREIEPGGPAADHMDLHARLPGDRKQIKAVRFWFRPARLEI